MDIDDIYSKIGGFGRQQRIYFFLLGLLNGYAALHMLELVFTGAEPQFVCVPWGNSSEKLNNTCPQNDVHHCKAIAYSHNFTSIATEWNLVCDASYWVGVAQSVFMAGVMVGAFLLGGVSDRFGRKKTFACTVLGMSAFGSAAGMAPDYTTFCCFRFFDGMSCAGNILAAFVLASEMVGTPYRALCGILFQVFFAAGIVGYSMLAYWIRNWRILTIASTGFGVLFLSLYCIIPESPRWLLAQGRKEEAIRVLKQIATGNSTTHKVQWDNICSPDTSPSTTQSTTGPRERITKMFCHRTLCSQMLIQMYSWFVNSSVYYGLTMASSNLGLDPYTSTALSGAVEIPAYFITIFLLGSLGRRWTLCGFMILGGISCLGIQLLPVGTTKLLTISRTTLALLGKLGIAASFGVIYVHSAELFPTTVRNSGMGLVSVAARVGGIVSPFLSQLGYYVADLQFTVFGLLSFSAGVFNLFLPETLNVPLPGTIADLLQEKRSEASSSPRAYGEYRPLPINVSNADLDPVPGHS